MKKIIALTAFIAAMLPLPAIARGLPQGPPPVPGQAVVRAATPKALAQAITSLSQQFAGVGVIDSISGRPVYLISYQLNANQTADQFENALRALSQQGTLTWEELNYTGQTGEGQTDSLWLSGLGLNADQFAAQYASPLMGVEVAHKSSRGAGVVVSVIDTGVDAGHPALSGAVSTQGASFVPGSTNFNDVGDGIDNDGDGFIDEQVGHGTFVAGLIHLVAPDAMILSARALDSEGRGNNFRIAQAIAWSIDRGAHVVNMSLGESYHSLAIVNMVNEANSKGVVICGAAGNGNTNSVRQYPACEATALGVTALDWNDVRAPFSNWDVRMDVAAPGHTEILNGVPRLDHAIIGPIPGGQFAVWKGTSFANAFVSGTIALVRSQNPQWPNTAVPASQVRSRILAMIADTGASVDFQNPTFAGQLGQARLSASGVVKLSPVAPPMCDIDCDSNIGASDLAILLSKWGPAPIWSRADLNADGVIDSVDLSLLLSRW